MKLYIVRHAIAMDREEFEGKDDSDRPLTDAGRKKMKKIAKGLHQFGVRLDMIVSSPYVRARDTAQILGSEFNMEDQLDFSESLVPPGNFDKLIGEINDTYNVNNLALVGHEPSLSQLISLLAAGGPRLAITMKKGGVCCLSADALGKDRRASIEWLLTPAILVDLAK